MATNSAGIRITQIGVSEPFAADYQFVFNSDWPSLAIAFEVVVAIPFVVGSATVKHGLGFTPFTIGWDITGGINNGRIWDDVSFDKDNIYISNFGTSDVTYSIKCYNLDITQQKNYTLPQFPTIRTNYDPTTGIKVSKYGKSIASADLRDFILHSRAQSPAVLNIITNPTYTSTGGGFTNYTIAYSNPANYIPWSFAFTTVDGSTYRCVRPGPAQAPPLFSLAAPSDNPPFYKKGQTVLTFLDYGSGKAAGSLVLLRDPLVLSNNLRIVY